MAKTPEPATLLISLLAREETPRLAAIRALAELFGPLERLSAPMAFGQTIYYETEMGLGLDRRLAVFERPTPLHELARIKKHCMALEASLAREGRRLVNIDPGLLTADGLILATHKYQGHRLPLGQDLYCELTLFFQRGRYRPLAWTYSDYAGDEMTGLLALIRERHLWRLKRRTAADSGEDQ